MIRRVLALNVAIGALLMPAAADAQRAAPPPPGSPWTVDAELEQHGRVSHPTIAGHQCGHLVTEDLRGGQMEGVETPKDRRIQRGGGFEQRIIESDPPQATRLHAHLNAIR